MRGNGRCPFKSDCIYLHQLPDEASSFDPLWPESMQLASVSEVVIAGIWRLGRLLVTLYNKCLINVKLTYDIYDIGGACVDVVLCAMYNLPSLCVSLDSLLPGTTRAEADGFSLISFSTPRWWAHQCS